MRAFCLLLVLLLQISENAINCEPVDLQYNSAVQEGKYTKINLNETASEELLDKWLSQAFSGLMAAMAAKRLEHIHETDKEALHVCSQGAKSVPEHARCVVKVLDAPKKNVVIKDTPASHIKSKPVKNSEMIVDKEDVEWIGGFATARAKRDAGFKVINRPTYELKSSNDEPMMTSLARKLTKTVRVFKNKDEGTESWRNTVERFTKIGEQAKEEKKRRETMKKRLRQMIDNTPPEYLDPRKPIAMKQVEMEDEEVSTKKMLAKKQTEEVRIPLKLMRDAVKLAMQLGGHNTTDYDKKTIKMVSPRLMSIQPEQEDDSLINLLSPSLFSLHDEGTGIEKLTSIPQLLKKLDTGDRESWMDFIIEAAGVSDAADKSEKELRKRKEKDLVGKDGVPLYFNKQNATEILGQQEKNKIEVFESLDKTYNQKQKNELDTQGFSFLTKSQMEKVYGKDSPYSSPRDLRRFKRLRDDPEKFVEQDIRALAEAEKFKASARRDITLSPFILTPLTFASVPLSNTFITLSPLVLSPITLSPAVLGPIILSPWVFVPLILSPRVLSPLIVNPLVFSPIILSPLVLHPLILVPGVFNPFILSPLVLSPFILSPQVFTPLILSPFALNPLILTPMVGSPLILSPFVLSPIILSPQALFAVVLSPYALSPLIESKLIAAEVVLSPSWLS